MLWLQAQGVASSYGQYPKSSRCFGVLRVDKRAGVSRALARHLQVVFVVHHLPDTTSSFSSQSLCHASKSAPGVGLGSRVKWQENHSLRVSRPGFRPITCLDPGQGLPQGNWASVSSCVTGLSACQEIRPECSFLGPIPNRFIRIWGGRACENQHFNKLSRWFRHSLEFRSHLPQGQGAPGCPRWALRPHLRCFVHPGTWLPCLGGLSAQYGACSAHSLQGLSFVSALSPEAAYY